MEPQSTNMVVISGRSNRKLANEIAQELGVELADQILTTFKDGEIRYELKDPVQGKDVYIVQSTSNPTNDNLMELLIITDALKRAGAGRITAVIPYFGYARQDRKITNQDPITAKLVANMIEAAGVDRVLTMDIHSNQIQGFFDIPFENVSGSEILVTDLLRNKDKENTVLVAPDAGSAKRNRKLADSFELGFALTDKERRKPNEALINGVLGDVKDKDLIIIDDIIDTGGTIAQVAQYLSEKGAKSITVGCTHGVLSEVDEKEVKSSKKDDVTLKTAPIDEIVILDTIDVPQEKFDKNKKLRSESVSTAKTFAKRISEMHEDWK